MKVFYLLMCIVGLVLPFSQFIPWVLEHGLNLQQLFESIMANKISAFAWLDVVISALVLIAFIRACLELGRGIYRG